ncbi:hypothetical protein COCSADRAFT_206085 [Bipolaris sorokiniana ND90Pr]|uniref:Uncharacterized protein n=1 Tax=Cochliobolus sativus (strain ND90Pr / ATCC 201652) TaxID=665912 RepID=M2TIP8_COCSN|nr:uncharacterized protein COCSADRAFT_206085 [Bipolaris sorokiniana ND90Pr]EMD69081.1 hypothetical protein COCSADRAFT_206085 [Bipolaris sorokiniana ND90Pr]
MHSLRRWFYPLLLVVGNGVVNGAVVPAPPDITAAPRLQGRQDIDAIDFVNILITALPQSLRQVAATNVPAVSSILWTEFLDNNRPQWFRELPVEVQRYLIQVFGPVTAAPPESGSVPTSVPASVTRTEQSVVTQTDGWVTSTTATVSTSSKLESESGGSTTAVLSQTTTRPSSFSSKQSFSSTSISPTASSSFSASSTPTISTPPPSSATPISTPSEPPAPPPTPSGLTSRQKLALGLALPLGFLSISILLLSFFLLRRHRKRTLEGSQPPSSPGFIPRFSFQQGPSDSATLPLTHHYTRGTEEYPWDDPSDIYDAYPETPAMVGREDTHTPMVAPALCHSHSSNRARGRRVSGSSLHSVAEMREPGEFDVESPVLGQYAHRKRSFGGGNREVGRRSSIPRKPVPSPSSTEEVPVNDARDTSVYRPTQAVPHTAAQYSGTGSSSSGLAVSSFSSMSLDAYLEDYGPEYYYTGGGRMWG